MLTQSTNTDAPLIDVVRASLEAVKVRGESVIVGNHANGVRFEETIPALYARYNEQDHRWVVGEIILDKGEYSWAFPRWTPSWWTPEKQFAIRYTQGRDAGHVIAYETIAGARAGARARKLANPEVLAVDLATGKEVPA
jgi:hypothetical protein